MTKRQRMLLNKAATDRKEHYKMYKSGGTWAFACIVLMTGIMWSAPLVHAQAAAADPVQSTLDTNLQSSGYNSGTDQENSSNVGTTNTGHSNTDGNTGTAEKAATVPTTPSDGTQNNAAATTQKPSPAPAPEAPVTTSTADAQATATNQITTATLNGTNPANVNSDGTISTADKTKVVLTTTAQVDANFKAEQIVKKGSNTPTASDTSSTISAGGVVLVPENSPTTAGTMVFKNQIDTSQAFTFTAELKSQAAGNGGGIGFIMQPVDPQKSGVGQGSDPSADIGIYGQPNTTFIGRDGYVDGSKADTAWGQLVVRQTDATGVLSGTTPTWASGTTGSVPNDEYATLVWNPVTVDSKNHMVTGSFTYTTYSDAARTKTVQTLTTGSATAKSTAKNSQGSVLYPDVVLNQSMSIAAFAAVGGLGPKGSDQRAVEIADVSGKGGFAATVKTMPIKFTYVDDDNGTQTTIHDPDVTNVDVGDTIAVGKTTDLSTHTFAPRVIDGYQFVKAVTSEGTNSLSVTNEVLNAATENNNVNNIVIYYTNQVHYTIQPVNAQGQAIAGLAPQQVTSQIGATVAAPTQAGYTGTSVTAPTTDGTVVKAVYQANVGNVQVNYTGLPANLTPTTAIEQGAIGSTYTVATPVIAGYTADLAAVGGTYVQNVNAKPLQVTVHYTASDNSYQVVPVDSTGKAIAALPATNETSKTDTSVAAPTYAGYTLVSGQTMPTTKAGVASYQLQYAANQYHVNVTYTGLPTNSLPTPNTATGTTGESYQINSPEVAGYTPDQTTIMGTYGPATTTNGAFTVKYVADTKVYKVQPVDASGNPIVTLAPTQYNGQTGNAIDYPTYAGYTVVKNAETVPTASKPIPVVNVKYTANPSKITVSYTGLPTDITPAVQTQTGVTDGTYTVNAPTIAGYTPDATILKGIYSNTGSLTKTITYTANDNSYTIIPVDENGNVIAGLSMTNGTTKTDAAIATPDYSAEGYSQVAGQTLITKPGVTSYKVQYTTQAQTITVNYTGTGLPTDQIPTVQTQSVKIGDTYSLISPTITGYAPDKAIVTGVYQNKGQTNFTVTYAPIDVTVTIQHTGLDSTTASTDAAKPQTVTGKYGTKFTINAADIPGYTAAQTTVSGTYSADPTANMYIVKYIGKPATVTINYTGANSATPQSVTLTGVVGGTYSQLSPTVTDYTPDQATVANMFTATNAATDTTTNKPITVTYTLNSSLLSYTINPVDTAGNVITGVTGIAPVTGHAKSGATVDTPDYTSLGYVTKEPNVTISTMNNQSFNVVYQKQITYMIQAVDTSNQPISTIPLFPETGYVGTTATAPTIVGYNAVSSTYTVPQTATTNANPLKIQYTLKNVTVTLVPVDSNGNMIAGLTALTVTQAGGTTVDESKLTPQTGYTFKAPTTIAVPISDTGISVKVPYLKDEKLGLSGSDTETYTGNTQAIDPTKYTVTLPDGSNYALKASDVELATPTATNVGDYKVQLTASGETAIKAALAQNYSVTFDTAKTGSLTISPKALTTAAANTALVPANTTDPAQNPQLATSIVVQGGTKVYDNKAATDAPTFKVLAPSQYADFTIPTLAASDFDTMVVSQDAGSYQVTLNQTGLKALQDANKNYSFDATDVQNGLFVITPETVTATVASPSKTYDGNSQTDPTSYVVTLSTGEKIADLPSTDFDTTQITSQNVGQYAVTLNSKGIADIQKAHTNYALKLADVTAGALNITPNTKAAISVNGTKQYDGTTVTDPAEYTTSVSSGLKTPQWTTADFDLTSSDGTSAAAIKNAGTYSVTLSSKGLADLQAANKNYQITSANVTAGKFDITKAPVTISANSFDTTYTGQAYAQPFTATVTGKPAQGDALVYTVTADADALNVNQNGYPITVTANVADNPNYQITINNGILKITPNTTTDVGVKAVAPATYNGTAATYSVSFPTGVTAPASWTAADFNLPAETNAGTYTVSLSDKGLADLQAVNSNYEFTSTNIKPATFKIGSAALATGDVAVKGNAKTYDGTATSDPTQYEVTLNSKLTAPANWTTADFDLTGITSQNVGGYTVTLSAQGLTDLQAANPNYQITKADITAGKLTINPRILTTAAANTATAPVNTTDASQNPQLATSIVVQGGTKVYDNKAATDASTFKVLGPSQYSDFTIPTLDASDFDTMVVSQDAGSYQVTLNQTGLKALQDANKNYSFNATDVQNGLYVITPAPITITAPSETTAYTGTPVSVTAGTVTSDNTTLKATPDYTIAVSGNAQDVGTYATTVVPNAKGNENYKITTVAGTITITPAKQMATIKNATKVYDDSTTDPTSYTVTLSTGDQTLPSSDFDVATTSGTATTGQNVGSYAVTLNQTGIEAINSSNKNYVLDKNSIKPGQLTITQASLAASDITVKGNTKAYDGVAANDPTKYGVTLSSKLTAPTNGWTTADFDLTGISSQNVGNYAVKLSAQGLADLQAANPNYAVTASDVTAGNFSITPNTTAKVNVTATAPAIYDGTAATYSVNLPTGVNAPTSWTADDFNLPVETNAGTYTVSLSDKGIADLQAANSNYQFASDNVTAGNFTIAKAAVTVSAPTGLTKVYDGSGYTVSGNATVTGQPAKGVIVKYHLSSLAKAVNVGSYTLNVISGDNPNYKVTVVPSTFTVTKNTQAVVQLGAATKVYDNDATTTPKVYSVTLPTGVSAPKQWTAADFKLSSDSQDVGTYTVELSAHGLQDLNNANANYSFATNNVTAGSFNITPASITITAPSVSKTYDGQAYTGTDLKATVSGAITGDGPVYTMTSVANDVNAGSYDLVITVDSAKNPNYKVAITNGTLTINPATLTAGDIAVQNKTRTYDGTTTSAPTYDVTLNSNLTAPKAGWTAADFDLSGITSSNVGDYAVKLSAQGLTDLQAANPNYKVDANDVKAGTFTITPAKLTAAIQAGTKVYDNDSTTGPTSYTVKLSTGDQVLPSSDFDVATTSQNVGSYAVTLNQTGIDAIKNVNKNYVLDTNSIKSGQLNITPAPITLTAPTNATKVYDGKAYATDPTKLVTVSGLPKNGAVLNYTVNDISKDVDAGTTYAITINADTTANPNYTFTIKNGSFKITPQTAAANAVQVATAHKIYDGDATTDPKTYGLTANSQYAGLVIPTTLTADDYDNDGVTSQNVGSYAVTLKQSGIDKINAVNKDYVLDKNSITGGKLIIDKRPVIIKANSVEKTYDGKQYGDPVTATADTVATGATLVYTVNVPTNVNVTTAAPITVTAKADANPNYTITTVNGNLKIDPKKLTAGTITLGGSSKVYNGSAANNPVTDTLQGPTGDSNFTVPTDWTTADFDNSGINSQNVGTYQVKLSQAGLTKLQQANPNYTFDMTSVKAGSFTITKAPLTVTLPALTKTYDGRAYSGSDDQYSVTGVPAGVTPPTLTLTDISKQVNAGTVPITATITSADAGNYAVTYANAGSLTISPKQVTTDALTVSSATKTYDNSAASVPTFTLTGPDATDYPNFTLPTITAADFDTSAAASQNVGAYDVKLTSATIAALQKDNPNYVISADSVKAGQLTITPKAITIAAPTLTKTYNGQAYTGANLKASVSDAVIGDDPVYTMTSVTNDVNAGSYDLIITADSAKNPNYKVTVTKGNLTIMPKPITGKVTVGNTSKTYDNDATKMPTFTVTGPAGYRTTQLDATDFDTSKVSQNAGSYAVTLNAAGIAKLNRNNPNFAVTAGNVQSGILTINKKDITITAPTVNKIYDGQADTGADMEASVSDAVTGDEPAYAMTSIANDVNAGGYDLIITADPAKNSNYNIKTTNGKLTITPKAITIAGPTLTKVYDGRAYTGTDLKATVNGAVGNDVPAYQLADLSSDVNAGGYDIGITFDSTAAANHNYTITPTAGHLTIMPKTISQALTINSESKVYDNDATKVPAFTLTGPDATAYPNFTMPTTTAADFDTSAAASQNVGSYDVKLTSAAITALQNDNPNYVISADSVKAGQLTITPKTITIAAPTLTKTYDGQAYTDADLKASVSGAVTGDDPVYTMTSVTDDINAGGYDLVIKANATQNPNYTVAVKNGKLTIAKKAITNAITISSADKTYDNDATDVPTFTLAGPTAVTDYPSLTVPTDLTAADFDTTAAKSQDVGTYAVSLTASGLKKIQDANGNYDISNASVVAGQLTIKQAPVTISAPQGLTKVYDGSGYTISDNAATVVGQPAKGTAVKYHLSSLADAVNVGSYTLSVIDDGNPNYKVTVVPSTFTVTKSDQATVQLGTATKVYDNDATTTPKVYDVTLPTGVSAPKQWTADDFELSSNSQDVGTYTVELSQQGLQDLNNANANYSFTANNVKAGSFNITPASITVTAPSVSKVYDGTAYNKVYQPNVTGTPAKAAAPEFNLTDISQDVNAGTYTVKAILKDANSNYTIKYVDGTLTINQAPVTITAPNLTKTYDGKAYTGSDNVAAVTGLPNTGKADALHYSLTDISQDINVKNGGYPITVTLGANPNYTVKTTAGSLTITPATPQYRFFIDSVYRQYSGQPANDPSVYPVTIKGTQLNQPTFTAGDFVRQGSSENVGSYPVTLSAAGWQKLQAANPNYVITPDPENEVAGNFVIEPVALAQTKLGTVAIGNQTKVYDGDSATDPTDYAVTVPGKLTAPTWAAADFTRADQSEDAGTYAVTLSKAGFTELQQLNPNYTIALSDITAGHLTITPAPVTITAPSGITKTDDGQPYTGTATATVTGVPAKGIPVSYQLNYGTNGDVGVHPIMVTLAPKSNTNYTITTVPGSYTIEPQPVTTTDSPTQAVTSTTAEQQATKAQNSATKTTARPGSKPGSSAKTTKTKVASESQATSHKTKQTGNHSGSVTTNRSGNRSNNVTTQNISSHTEKTVVQATNNYSGDSLKQTANGRAANATTQVTSNNIAKTMAQSAESTSVSGTTDSKTGTTQQNATAQGQLPQTNEQQSSWLAVVGTALMSLLGLIGIKKRKSDR